MPNVTYIDHQGVEYNVSLEEGTTLMEGALDNNVPGIDGDCGGVCACATCHIYVESGGQVNMESQELDEQELGMLELTDGFAANSRLGCQIRLTGDHEGMVVRIPADQR